MNSNAANSHAATQTQFPARVASLRTLCGEHFEVVLECEDAAAFEPGRFLQITSRGDQLDAPVLRTHEWSEGTWPKLEAADLKGRRPLLRRPYSPADVRRAADGSWRITLIVRVVGPGTACLSRREAGETLDCIGPIGNRFEIPPDCKSLLLVCGGTGVAPMIYLARHLRRTRGADAPRMLALLGAATRDALCVDLDTAEEAASLDAPTRCIQQFGEADVPALLSTDDGSVGFRGTVVALAEAWLDAVRPDAVETILCAVGPEPMMAAAACMAAKFDLPIQVSLERKMGCGLGTCQSCVVPILTGEGDSWQYKLTCKDGPVFDGRQVLWAREQEERPD